MTADTATILQAQIRANPGAHSLLDRSLRWMADLYDHDAQLLTAPETSVGRHLVRESIWYALGLVVAKHCADDLIDDELSRVPLLIHKVLKAQWNTPGKAWHGTFRRSPTESDPSSDARMWIDYDPNWRQFIGSVLVLLLRLEGDGILAEQADAMRAAVKLSVQGEPVDRVPPTYTNIALMRAWLETETAELLGDQYRSRALKYARLIADKFDQYGTFPEYNSPTYYGINLYALGLWQHYSREPELNELGNRISSSLWQDMARFYHPMMKNFCGPWSRSYGMDMQQYVAAAGLWIWSTVGEQHAPFPMAGLKNGSMHHAHDFALGPLAAITATLPPADIAGQFVEPSDSSNYTEHNFSQIITDSPSRVAHAWLTPTLMAGLETSDVSFRGNDQYHPCTLHWLHDGAVHWLRLRFAGRLQGTIKDGSIVLKLIPDAGVTQCLWQSSDPLTITGNKWHSPGLSLATTTTLHATQRPQGILLSGIAESAGITIAPVEIEESS